MTERVRFSPAPSGLLHLGGARTALFNWLVARRNGGSFILRIEDTDAGRSERRFEAAILEDLAWLGLDWNEGPEVGGPHEPYRQSERGHLYAVALEHLTDAGAVYPCFCDPASLDRERAEDLAAGRVPRYRGHCRGMPAGAAADRVAAGERPAWRFAVDPHAGAIAFDDLVHGRVTHDAATIGDFAVVRSDGRAVYDLACVVDDAAMGITTVIRGDDHVPNTPRQLLLYRALGLRTPRFAHLPLVFGAEGEPLSKSGGAMPVATLRKEGFLPVAVIGHLALLGWSDPSGREVLTRAEIVESFDLARVSPAPATHDAARLRWLNARHLRALTPGGFENAVAPFLPELPSWLDRRALVEALRDEVETAADAARLAMPVISPLAPDAEALAALASPAAVAALRATRALATRAQGELGPGLADELKADMKRDGLALRDALPAVRAALTGRAHGLPLGVLFGLLGKEETLGRLDAAEVDSSEVRKA